MRNPLIGWLVATTAFFFGVTVQDLFQSEAAGGLENTKFARQINFVGNYPSLNEVVERKIAENPVFSIIEGDYYSAEDQQTSMYLYSLTDENEKPTVGGRIEIKAKTYEINSRNQNRLNPANAAFTFETEKIKGVRYRFKGKFIKKEYQDGEIVLSGRLQKFIKGKMVEEAESQYIFYYHKCSQ
ncbi:MAG TPA: hypothetical protein VF599_05170 [Pyrinomonadaceae bacterium]|jgi:hypothetical protein